MSFLYFITLTLVVGACQQVQSSTEDSLKSFLGHFNGIRHHHTNSSFKNTARIYIQEKFKEFGLETWTEEFESSDKACKGVNIIGVLWGQTMLSSDPFFYIINANYDTKNTSAGVDDNGSGMAALLEIAKQMSQAAGNCTRRYTVMFVASDFGYEDRYYCPMPFNRSDTYFGINEFVKILLNSSRTYDAFGSGIKKTYDQIYGKLKNAIILDTIMNYNQSTLSQSFDNSSAADNNLNTLYGQIKKNEFRGDFICVISNKDGWDAVTKMSSMFKSPDGIQAKIYNYTAEIKSSKILAGAERHFWEANLPAIRLTDTKELRGYMRQCAGKVCDDLSHMTTETTKFMISTVNSVVAFLEDGIQQTCRAISPKAAKTVKFLRHFEENRNHITNPEGKAKALKYIVETFRSFGLNTWKENFTARVKDGINVIAKLNGITNKTILIGSHYDSQVFTRGYDDSGSGVAAVLRAAEILSNIPKTCKRNNSIIFAVFDLEEYGLLGSKEFVKNYTKKYSSRDFLGAIIMDTVMDYNNETGSQSFPPQMNNSYLHRDYHFLKLLVERASANQLRGNQLGVFGRTADRELINTFSRNFNNARPSGTLTIELPLSKKTSKFNRTDRAVYGDFIRSDHASFWNEDLKAIFMSDTADMRGVMRQCYHRWCDNPTQFSSESKEFLAATAFALATTADHYAPKHCSLKPTTKATTPQNNNPGTASSFGFLYINLVFCCLFVYLTIATC